MKIIYYAYREWATNIFSKIKNVEKYLITHNDYSIIDTIKPNLVFFIGWSDIIPKYVVENHMCICLHPSPLPRYRGGSPIQNQIINGEIDSAVTFFIMDEGVDTGEIISQEYLSLTGKLDKIFKDIEFIGENCINKIITDYVNNSLICNKQDNDNSTTFKRKKDSESEITIEELLNSEPIILYNKIRSLNDPYPNAYIKCRDGKKLFLTESKYEK
jgi:methionyl-tRNA formyltransferase